jgi:hypothetical protein
MHGALFGSKLIDLTHKLRINLFATAKRKSPWRGVCVCYLGGGGGGEDGGRGRCIDGDERRELEAELLHLQPPFPLSVFPLP